MHMGSHFERGILMKRKLGKKLLVLLALVMVFSMALSACGGDSDKDGDSKDSDALKVGFIYIGTENDGGYTQAQNNGRVAVQDYFGDKVETIIAEEIDDTNSNASKEAAINLIDKGCKVVIGTSYGFGAPLKELADSGEYDDVVFLHFSDNTAFNSKNLMNYFGAMEEPRYLSGVIAGLQTSTNKIGYVAAFPYTEVNIGINAFALGVQSVNPSATVEVRYINSWYDPGLEKAAAEALLSAGCDVITQHADTPAPQLAAATQGKLAIGYNLDNSKLEGLGDAFLTAPIWNHEKFLIPTIESILAGTFKPVEGTPFGYYGTMADGYVDLAPLTQNVSDEAKAKVEELMAKMISGELKIFTGPISSADGTITVAAGTSLDEAGIWDFEGINGGVIKGVTTADQK
jgi:basic membrane protein A